MSSIPPTEQVKPEKAELATTTTSAPVVYEPLPSIDFEKLTIMALERGPEAVGIMKDIVVIRREMQAEAAERAFNVAMAAFQKACPIIPKNRPVTNKDGSHRYNFTSKEYLVAHVGDLIAEHGFSYSFDTDPAAPVGQTIVICIVTHVLGHKKQSRVAMPTFAGEKSGMNAQQAVASAGSYGERYALARAFGITFGDEDDDANTLHDHTSARKKFEQFKAKRDGLKNEGAQEAQIVHPGNQDEIERPVVTHIPGNITKELEAFLLSVDSAKDPQTMTNRWRIATEFTDVAQRKAAKDKVGKVAKELGFYWDFSNKCFINQKS